MEAALTHDEFTKHLKKKFQVQVDENTAVELELTGISELKQYPRQEEFALEFRGPANMFLGQGIRFFKHEQMGQFEIFIVPIRQDNQGLYYEAVFNRVRE
jgi:hypothetical protein